MPAALTIDILAIFYILEKWRRLPHGELQYRFFTRPEGRLIHCKSLGSFLYGTVQNKSEVVLPLLLALLSWKRNTSEFAQQSMSQSKSHIKEAVVSLPQRPVHWSTKVDSWAGHNEIRPVWQYANDSYLQTCPQREVSMSLSPGDDGGGG